MKKILMAAGMAALMSTSAMAQNVGVTMALFDDNFLTVLRNGIQELGDSTDGVDVQIEDARTTWRVSLTRSITSSLRAWMRSS